MMKHSVIPLLCTCLLSGWLVPSDVTAADYALLVGVKNYGKRSGLNPLLFPENDVEDLAKVLIGNGYAPDNVTVMTQTRSLDEPALSPTDENILRELDLILKGRDASDNLLIAFAGHGVKYKDAKTSYFCPINAEATTRQHLISYDTLYEKLRLCPAQRKLLLSDACRNDPLSASARSAKSVTRPEPQVPPGSTVALFACQAGQEAREDEKLKHGVFFHFILEGLRGEADKTTGISTGNGNSTVELTELVAFTQKGVQDYVRSNFRAEQSPELQTSVSNLQQLLRYPVLRLTPGEITNSIGMKLKLIPAGEFLMGSTLSPEEIVKRFNLDEDDAKNYTDEHPRHRVRITKSFYLGAHEVTVGQFRQFTRDSGYKTEAETDGEGGYGFDESTGKFEGRDTKYNWQSTGFTQNDAHPVVNVTWNDAVAFCSWLSRKDGTEYRLPTEAEWEYSCRGGSTTLYQHSDNPEGLAFVGNVADGTVKAKLTKYDYSKAINARDGFVFTAPVGEFRTNSFGLHDMHGNVREWCSDWHGREYYGSSAASDPGGPSTGSFRVSRGGSWFIVPQFCRSANRSGDSPGDRYFNLGFRVLRSSVR